MNNIKLLGLFVFFLALSWSCAQEDKPLEYSSTSYNDLVELFKEFRVFQEPVFVNGIPDYSKATMAKKRVGLDDYRKRLEAINPNGWPVNQKADFVLVWGEMNGMQFYHDVLMPWSRDPVFYLPSQGGGGPIMDFRLRIRELPIPAERIEEVGEMLKAVPAIYAQAKINLVNARGDLAKIAIHSYPQDMGMYEEIAEEYSETRPELAELAKTASEAVADYGKWLEENIDNMPVAAGIGVDNYNWWLKNVHLFPYTHVQCEAIVDHEYSRIITFLELEENRNRNLPPLVVADTPEEWYARLDFALNYMLEWCEKEGILSIPDWLHAGDYSNPNEERRDLPSEPTMDSRGREREVLPGETHEFIGHLFDEKRLERDNRPIRGVHRMYNMDWIRSEGFAVYSEELFMMAGDLDERPRRGREIEYLMNASHMSLSIPDLKMHSNEISFDEARTLCAEIMPYNWSDRDDRMVWYEQQSNLRFPAFHTGCVMGKSQLTKLFREKAMQLGEDFVIRDFFDEFLAAGMIPMSLTRWEMIGDDTEIKEICPLIK